MISKPTLLLDSDKCRQNIDRMVQKANRLGLKLRPHFKTHQSREIAQWFRELGIDQITVSSVEMAQYFAEDAWRDISIAFPVNILEMNAIKDLALKVNLHLLVESVASIQALGEALRENEKVNLFIKIDLGSHRTGIAPENTDLLQRLIHEMEAWDSISFKGFLAHAGHSYRARSKAEITQVHQDSLAKIAPLRQFFETSYPHLIFSYGDTPTASVMENFPGIEELRPGNFVFYDWMQQQIGACTVDDIALAMACPVVALHPEREEMVLYGGAIHFSKDFIHQEEGLPTYGIPVESEGLAWGKVIPGAYLSRLSQEHGIVKMPKEALARFKVGDILKVLPIHSCLSAHLMKSYRNLEGKKIEMFRAV